MKKLIKNRKGISILEILFALTLVAISLLLMAKVLFLSYQSQRKSQLHFNMVQKLEYYKGFLLSQSFKSISLSSGVHQRIELKNTIHWQVTDLSESLKQIILTITDKQLQKKISFFKSKFIMEVDHE